MALVKYSGNAGTLFYDTATKIIYEQAPDGTLNPKSISGAALVTDLRGGYITPSAAYDADQLCGAELKIAIPAGATKVMLAPVSGTTAVRAALGDAAVLATTTSGARIPGTAAGTNPVPPIELSVPTGATHMSVIAESGAPTISIVWGT